MGIKYLFGLKLTEAESNQVKKVHEDHAMELTMEDLVDRWSKLIAEIRIGYSFGIFDYSNDVSIRTIIERLLPAYPPRIQSKVLELVEPLDLQFLELTESPPDVPESQGSNDRWSRLPKKLKDEFLEY